MNSEAATFIEASYQLRPAFASFPCSWPIIAQWPVKKASQSNNSDNFLAAEICQQAINLQVEPPNALWEEADAS